MIPFVGIISSNKDYEIIKKDIKGDNVKINLMQLKEDYIENIKNVKFDTIVVNKEVINNKKYLKKIIEGTKHLVVNSDINLELEDYKNVKSQIITYGFNSKSTITISSINENSIILCTQRNIQGINKKIILQQENRIKNVESEHKNPYNVMAYFAITRIYNE